MFVCFQFFDFKLEDDMALKLTLIALAALVIVMVNAYPSRDYQRTGLMVGCSFQGRCIIIILIIIIIIIIIIVIASSLSLSSSSTNHALCLLFHLQKFLQRRDCIGKCQMDCKGSDRNCCIYPGTNKHGKCQPVTGTYWEPRGP